MNDSMAYAGGEAGPSELPLWKSWLGGVSAVLLAILFLVSGIWKISEPFATAVRMVQAKVPHALSLPAALGFGIAETAAGVLILVPRFRRWGAWLTGLLLVAFMVYIGYYYNDLRGGDCSCFPWIKRAVGPAFFLSDGIMLALAAIAGWCARPSRNLRSALLVLAAVGVFAFVSFGIHMVRQSGVQAPEFATVDGQQFPLRQGRVFLFFFDPECPHCDLAARQLAKLNWGETKIVVVATQLPRFGKEFLESTGLRGGLCLEPEKLKKPFAFVDVPYGVALENGYQRASFTNLETGEAVETLRKLGFLK